MRIVAFNAILLYLVFMVRLPAAAQLKEIEEYFQKEEKVTLTAAAPDESIKRPVVEYQAGNLKDPFKSPILEIKPLEGSAADNAEPKPFPSITVQGLIWGGRFNQAIINNKVVKEGDTIEGVRILSIDKSGVTVFFEGKNYDLGTPALASAPVK